MSMHLGSKISLNGEDSATMNEIKIGAMDKIII